MMQIINRLKFSLSVRVRYAPSPTGFMHLGGVRTALLNYAYAKQHHGSFIIRIENTDQKRNVQGSIDNIFQTLAWFGIKADESIHSNPSQYGPYIQSQRLSIYKQIQKQFLKKGYAYPCFCEHQRKQTYEETNQMGYDGRCRALTFPQIKEKIQSGQPYAVRIKSNLPQFQIAEHFQDKVYGEVKVSSFDDFIIVKRDGWPTYHFANVIDDWKMGITHVIRGQEWLTNTSKHIYLYKLLGKTPPSFIHLPLLLSIEGKKLSKRDPTSPIHELRKKGYQKEAIINFISFLGLGFEKDGETSDQLITLDKLVKQFRVEKVKKMPTRSSLKKLNHYNRHYIRQKWLNKDEGLIQELCSQMRKIHQLPPGISDQIIRAAMGCVIDRITTYQDLRSYGYFFKSINYSQSECTKDIEAMFGKGSQVTDAKVRGSESVKLQKNGKIIHNLRLIFEHVLSPEQFTQPQIAKRVSEYLYDNQSQLSNEDVYHLLRLAITGRKSGLNIIKTCELIGKEEASRRLEAFGNMLN